MSFDGSTKLTLLVVQSETFSGGATKMTIFLIGLPKCNLFWRCYQNETFSGGATKVKLVWWWYQRETFSGGATKVKNILVVLPE